MSDSNISQKNAQTYDKLAQSYGQRWFDFPLGDRIDQFTNYLKPGRVLDLGCGPGRDMLAFQERGFTAIGLDRSEGMLKEAAKNGAGPLVLADARRLPFANHAFRGVWAMASLLHLPKIDLPTALSESHRVLDHGHILVTVKQGDRERWQDEGDSGQRFFADYHPAEIELALERANFHVLWVSTNDDRSGRDIRWIRVIGWTKLNTPKVGANAVIFNDAGETLLTRRTDNHQWCIPGGHLEAGEQIEQAAIREALEETGLTVEVEGLSGMYNMTYPAHIFPEGKPRLVFLMAFRCKVLGGELTLNEEVEEFGWFSPDKLPADLMLHHKQRVLDAHNLAPVPLPPSRSDLEVSQ